MTARKRILGSFEPSTMVQTRVIHVAVLLVGAPLARCVDNSGATELKNARGSVSSVTSNGGFVTILYVSCMKVSQSVFKN